MSRELKFRAWDTYDKMWVYAPKIKSTGKIVDFDIDDEGYHEFTAPEGRYILEQYTGLKDKNGEEIYEGDIITTPDWRTEPERELVEFSEITHGFNPFVIGCYECLAPEGDEVEVIGNIHENPELLKKEGK